MAQTEEVPESHLEDFQVEAQDLVAHAEEHNSSSEFFVAHAQRESEIHEQHS